MLAPRWERMSTSSAGAGAGASACTATVVVVTRPRFCLLLLFFLGAPHQKTLLFTRATTRETSRSDVDTQAGRETTTSSTRTSSNEKLHKEQTLPRHDERTNPGAPATADDFFDDDVPAGEGKSTRTVRATSSYRTPLPPEDALYFDVVEGSTSTTPTNQAAAPTPGRAALEVGAAGTRSMIVTPPTTTGVDGEDEGDDEVPVEDEDAEYVASEKPEQKPEPHDRPLEKDREDHVAPFENNTPHHRPNLRGGRTSSATSSSKEAASSFSTVAQLEKVKVKELHQADGEKSSFLNSTASEAAASSAEIEEKSGDEFLKSSDFVQKTAGSVLKTTSGQMNQKEVEHAQLHQEQEEQQRTVVKVGDLLGCVCSAGEPASSLSDDVLHRNPWLRPEPLCNPPAFCPVFGRPYYVPWNAPLSYLDQSFKSARLVKHHAHHDQEEKPARTGGRSPDASSSIWERAQALVEAARSRIFSTPIVDLHEERLFREIDVQFDAEERLADGLAVDPRLLENPPPGALVRPVTALFDLDEVDSDGRKTGLRGRWSSLTNADPFLLRFTPDLDAPHSQYRMFRVTHRPEFLNPHGAMKSTTPPPPAADGPRTEWSGVIEGLALGLSLSYAAEPATSADRAVFEAPSGLHRMCGESCLVYMYEYVNGNVVADADIADDNLLRVLLRVRGALVRYAEDPDFPGTVSKVGFFGDPDSVAEVLHVHQSKDEIGIVLKLAECSTTFHNRSSFISLLKEEECKNGGASENS
ncbi:unnamed protein product [Amoebophrya sp. A120]|nr:unnamed protein product [Amoebophrya sp. A120]|eukprot:GSA120T00024725001.1